MRSENPGNTVKPKKKHSLRLMPKVLVFSLLGIFIYLVISAQKKSERPMVSSDATTESFGQSGDVPMLLTKNINNNYIIFKCDYNKEGREETQIYQSNNELRNLTIFPDRNRYAFSEIIRDKDKNVSANICIITFSNTKNSTVIEHLNPFMGYFSVTPDSEDLFYFGHKVSSTLTYPIELYNLISKNISIPARVVLNSDDLPILAFVNSLNGDSYYYVAKCKNDELSKGSSGLLPYRLKKNNSTKMEIKSIYQSLVNFSFVVSKDGSKVVINPENSGKIIVLTTLDQKHKSHTAVGQDGIIKKMMFSRDESSVYLLICMETDVSNCKIDKINLETEDFITTKLLDCPNTVDFAFDY